MDNLDKAEASYDRALRLDLASTRARRGLIKVYWERGNTERVLQQGQEAARVGSADDIETLQAMAEAYSLGGLPRLALPLLHEVLARDPLNEAALSFFSITPVAGEVELNELIRIATLYLEQVGDQASDSAITHSFIGIAHHLLGRHAASRNHHNTATSLTRQATPAMDSVFPLFFSAALYDAMDDAVEPGRARALWRRGVELTSQGLQIDPDNPRMRAWRGAFYGYLGNREALSADEQDVLAAPTKNVADLMFLAAGRAALGDNGVAIDLLNQNLDEGRLFSLWEVQLTILAPKLVASPAFEEVRAAHEVFQARLEEQYGPDLP